MHSASRLYFEFLRLLQRVFGSARRISCRAQRVRLKINCVVMNGVNTDELADFLDFTRDRELDVRFIEWMPFDDNRWKDSKFFSYQVWRVT